MYACNRGIAEDKIETVRNQLTSPALPALKRSYMSFHHICGYPETATGSPKPCSITVVKTEGGLNERKPQLSDTEAMIYTVPEEKLLNDGPLSATTEWFYEKISLGIIAEGSRITLRSTYDANFGAVGFDNIHFHTPQK